MKLHIRLIIMFSITLIICILLMFWNPKSKYLGIYKNKMTIEYNFNEKNYDWKYNISNNIIDIKTIDKEKWEITPKESGTAKLDFCYMDENNECKYTITYDLKIKNNKIYWVAGMANGLYDYPNPY